MVPFSPCATMLFIIILCWVFRVLIGPTTSHRAQLTLVVVDGRGWVAGWMCVTVRLVTRRDRPSVESPICSQFVRQKETKSKRPGTGEERMRRMKARKRPSLHIPSTCPRPPTRLDNKHVFFPLHRRGAETAHQLEKVGTTTQYI